MVDEYGEWMQRAVVEARGAAASGDVPVGALVFDASGTLIAAAHNERELRQDPTAHAEILALRAAAESARRLAASRHHSRGHAGAVPDVRRRDSGGAGAGGRVRGVGRKSRRGGVGARSAA